MLAQVRVFSRLRCLSTGLRFMGGSLGISTPIDRYASVQM